MARYNTRNAREKKAPPDRDESQREDQGTDQQEEIIEDKELENTDKVQKQGEENLQGEGQVQDDQEQQDEEAAVETPDQEDDDIPDTEEAALKILHEHWSVDNFTELIRDGTWLRGQQNPQFDLPTLQAAAELARESRRWIASEQECTTYMRRWIGELWDYREKGRETGKPNGKKIGNTWKLKQDNMIEDMKDITQFLRRGGLEDKLEYWRELERKRIDRDAAGDQKAKEKKLKMKEKETSKPSGASTSARGRATASSSQPRPNDDTSAATAHQKRNHDATDQASDEQHDTLTIQNASKRARTNPATSRTQRTQASEAAPDRIPQDPDAHVGPRFPRDLSPATRDLAQRFYNANIGRENADRALETANAALTEARSRSDRAGMDDARGRIVRARAEQDRWNGILDGLAGN